MSKRTVYYEDPLQDDFAHSHGKIKAESITGKYPYERSKLWMILSGILYYSAVLPLVYLMMKLGFGLKIVNKRSMKALKSGAFLYGNHSNGFPDAVCPAIVSAPRRAFVVTSAEAVSIRGIRALVAMLGAVPLPSDYAGWKLFWKSIEKKTEKNTVMIYPEAHIWPYYTGIRPFSESSFKYPVRMNRPVVASVLTYRKRKVFRNLPPLVTLTLSDPFRPSDYASAAALRDAVYAFMTETAGKDNYEYWTYQRRTAE